MQGHANIPLNIAGEEQARLAANLLSDTHFNAIYSSDLVRAQRTAEIIVLGRELEVKTTELLREQYFGKIEGSLWAKTAQIFDDRRKLSEDEPLHHRIADEETHYEVITRLFTFLREASITHQGQTILVVAHGGIMRYLLARLGVGSLKDPTFIKNTGFINLRSDGADYFLDEISGIE